MHPAVVSRRASAAVLMGVAAQSKPGVKGSLSRLLIKGLAIEMNPLEFIIQAKRDAIGGQSSGNQCHRHCR